MKIKKGDMVRMMIGKDRGKTGKVIRALPETRRVVVEGLNLATKHQRPKREGEKGQKIQFARAIPVARVQLMCTKCNKPTRVGFHLLDGGKKARACAACHELID